MWSLDPNATSLRCLTFWSALSSRLEEFELASRGRTFASGEGLPDAFGIRLEAVLDSRAGKDSNFPRALVATKEGLNQPSRFRSLAAKNLSASWSFSVVNPPAR